ncbi:MAG: FCD domain-containing protein, partial [Rhizobium sp.]|nr:FCD domain-containing protein [Rhizobium sp.]
MKDFKLYSDDFHDIFFRYADNSRLYNASFKIRSQFSILTNRYQNFTIAKSVVFIEHKAIAAAITSRDFDKAALLMTSHFEHAKNYLLQNIKLNDIK